MNNKELIKGDKFQSFHEACDWIAKDKPYYFAGSLFIDCKSVNVKWINRAWSEMSKAISKPEPVVSEGWVPECQIEDNEIVFKSDLEDTGYHARVTLTIYQGGEG